jgi:hypothetical protein
MFDLSCHSIVKSRYIFGKKARKPPPTPPPRHKISFRKQSSDDTVLQNGGQSTFSSDSFSKNKPPPDRTEPEQKVHHRKDSWNRWNDQSGSQEFNRDNINSYMNQPNSDQNSQESNSHHERKSSSASSKTSKSSRQRISDKNQLFNNESSYPIENFGIRYQAKETVTIFEEPDSISQTSSSKSQNFPLLPEIQPLNIKKKTVPTQKNTEQHVKLGCSPPSHMGLQDHNIYEDYNEKLQQNLYKQIIQTIPQTIPQTTLQHTSQDNIQAQIPQMPAYMHNKYEIISQLQKSTYNKVYYGRHIYTADNVIVKFYKSHSRWENETYFLKALKSKMIVKLEDISVNPAEEQERFIITRYFGKSLDEIAGTIYDNKADIKNVLFGICKAVEWCHSKGVVVSGLNLNLNYSYTSQN